MARNNKLTDVLKGRRITALSSTGAVATLAFDDGSQMVVQTHTDGVAPPPPPQSLSGKVQAVHQDDTTLALELAGGESLQLLTKAATSSVMVRAKDHTLRYAD